MDLELSRKKINKKDFEENQFFDRSLKLLIDEYHGGQIFECVNISVKTTHLTTSTVNNKRC